MSEIVKRFAIADHNDDIPAAVQVARDAVKQAFLRGELDDDVPALARLLMGDVDHQGVMTAEAWPSAASTCWRRSRWASLSANSRIRICSR
jgi:hypothetical protein